MLSRVSVLVAAAAISYGGIASAVTLPSLTDSYEGTYDVESINTGSNLHTVWLPGLVASNYWQFDSNGGVFDYQAGSASLTGTIVNNTDATKQFAVDINFSFDQKGGRIPKCEFGAACGSAQYATQAAQFEYFTFGSATLTGLEMLDGLILSLSVAPVDGTYPPQLGFGGNNKDLNEFGLSTWFFWTVAQNTTGTYYKSYGQGDVNIELTPVPLPAALPLMLTALGLLGFVARRRRFAHA